MAPCRVACRAAGSRRFRQSVIIKSIARLFIFHSSVKYISGPAGRFKYLFGAGKISVAVRWVEACGPAWNIAQAACRPADGVWWRSSGSPLEVTGVSRTGSPAGRTGQVVSRSVGGVFVPQTQMDIDCKCTLSVIACRQTAITRAWLISFAFNR